jgi:hypothetical protein
VEAPAGVSGIAIGAGNTVRYPELFPMVFADAAPCRRTAPLSFLVMREREKNMSSHYVQETKSSAPPPPPISQREIDALNASHRAFVEKIVEAIEKAIEQGQELKEINRMCDE